MIVTDDPTEHQALWRVYMYSICLYGCLQLRLSTEHNRVWCLTNSPEVVRFVAQPALGRRRHHLANMESVRTAGFVAVGTVMNMISSITATDSKIALVWIAS